MKVEKFRYLAGVIAAHKDRTVVGRTRLQKTIKLLQRIGLPTDYHYRLFFYGPYSDGIKSDLGLLEVLGLASEEENVAADGTTYYKIRADKEAELPQLDDFKDQINLMESSDTVALELAATYDAFQELGFDRDEAMARLRRKKREKCTPENVEHALKLLKDLQLIDT